MGDWQNTFIILCGSFLMLIFLVSGLWAIDIGFSGTVVSIQTGETIMATNGDFVREPIQQYHMGLYLVILSSFINMVLLAYYVSTSKK